MEIVMQKIQNSLKRVVIQQSIGTLQALHIRVPVEVIYHLRDRVVSYGKCVSHAARDTKLQHSCSGVEHTHHRIEHGPWRIFITGQHVR